MSKCGYVTIIGKTNVGKSTFLKILSGKINPNSGSVFIEPNRRLSVLEQNQNEFDDYVEYQNNSIRLDRPRNYWVALPNEVNLSEKDFEIIIELNLNSIPKGHETLFSQSSILKILSLAVIVPGLVAKVPKSIPGML